MLKLEVVNKNSPLELKWDSGVLNTRVRRNIIKNQRILMPLKLVSDTQNEE